jgi:hypothetical protein
MSTSESDNDYTHGDNRKTILVSIFSLFALVILFINLHIYFRYRLRRQASLHRETTNDQVAPDDQIHSIEEPMIGLDPCGLITKVHLQTSYVLASLVMLKS